MEGNTNIGQQLASLRAAAADEGEDILTAPIYTPHGYANMAIRALREGKAVSMIDTGLCIEKAGLEGEHLILHVPLIQVNPAMLTRGVYLLQDQEFGEMVTLLNEHARESSLYKGEGLVPAMSCLVAAIPRSDGPTLIVRFEIAGGGFYKRRTAVKD